MNDMTTKENIIWSERSKNRRVPISWRYGVYGSILQNTLGFHTEWDGGDFAEFKTAGGELSLFGV